jgi:hypothetical protein
VYLREAIMAGTWVALSALALFTVMTLLGATID